MLQVGLILNVLILGPVVWALVHSGMEGPFGPATDARRILTCVYAAIGLVSVALFALHLSLHEWAVPMTLALFAVQITYKLLTVPVVGVSNPVVATNLLVVAVQITAVAIWSLSRG
ncbi:MAG: hypothetical protein AB3N17_01425 [Tateyamaria sp.]